MKKPLLFLLFAFMVVRLSAQIETPAASPTGTISQRVGLTDIKIEYSRPSVKGRVIFGELVPFDQVWRTGANASTKITIGDNATIGGNEIKKGTYALYTIPGKRDWTIIFNKNTEHWGAEDYKQEEDAFRLTVKPTSLSDKVETFTIEIGNITSSSADISLMWDNTKVTFTITLDTDSKVMESINSKMAGPSSGDYYAAARYYFDTKKDLKKALEWVNKSIELGGDKYWIVRQKALIQAALGDYAGAIASAELSLTMAKKDDNAEYVRMNQKSIDEWRKK